MGLQKLWSLMILLAFLVTSCGTPPQTNQSAVIEIQITGSEPKEIETETIPQQNCTGTAEVENTVQKSRTIQYVIEVQNGTSVNANGQIGFAGTDIELGATVANHFGQSYGTSESLSRSITVKAGIGTDMQHTIRQVEIWKIGQAKISVGGQETVIPFKFRSDFAIELVNSVDLKDCGTSNTENTTSPTAQPFTPATSQASSSTQFEVFANLSWQDTGIQINSGDRLRIIWDGKSKWRGVNSGDFSDPLGGYIDPNSNYACTSLMPANQAGWNALVAKIGENGTPTNPFKLIPSGNGTLYLAMNDCDKQRYDNEGSVIVTIEVQH